jgi:hypothetical protein
LSFATHVSFKALLSSAQQIGHGHRNFEGRHRFCDMGLKSGCQCLPAVFDSCKRSHCHSRHTVATGQVPDLPNQVITVVVGEADIANEAIEPVTLKCAKRFFSGSRLNNLTATLPQNVG